MNTAVKQYRMKNNCYWQLMPCHTQYLINIITILLVIIKIGYMVLIIIKWLVKKHELTKLLKIVRIIVVSDLFCGIFVTGVCQIVGGGYGSGQPGSNSLMGATSAALEQQLRERRRDVVTLVRKHWKCSYVECSAKYNWHVVAVFKELMKAVDALHTGKEVCSPMMDNIHGALDRNKCCIQWKTLIKLTLWNEK